MSSSPPEKAGRREWIGLAILALPAMLISMDLTVLHLAVPQLSAELRPSSSELLWIVDVYGFMLAGLLIPMGTLGDRIGRRRLLLAGAAAFAAASALAALSQSAEALIATRALLGVAGATLMPSTLALIRNMFHDPRQRTTAISVWMMGFMVGGMVGPLVGGVLLEWFDWRAVFLMALPVMALLLVAGPLLLPEHRESDPGRFDLLGAAQSLAAMLAVIYGVKRLAEDGASWWPVALIGGGAALGAVFLARQRRVRDPLIDVALFRQRTFSVALAANTMSVFVMMGMFLFTAQYLQLVRGLSPLDAGLWTLPQTVVAMAASMAAPALARRVAPGHVVAAGLAVAAVGFVILAAVDGPDALGLVVAGMVVVTLGLVPVFALATDLILTAAPPERAGAASGISETGSELGGALGLALLGSLGTAVYRDEIADTLPGGLPAHAVAAARDTLGGAADAARALADPEALLAAAQSAFLSGLQAAALVSAVLAAGLALPTARLLRNVRPAEHVSPDPAVEPAAA